MNKLKTFVFLTSVAIPSLLLASTGNEFGAAEFTAQADKIQGFIFGPPLKIIGLLSAAGSFVGTLFTSNPRPLLTFGGISLAAGVLPHFIDGVFGVSGMLLP